MAHESGPRVNAAVFAWIALGGALGSVLRFGVDTLIGRVGGGFLWGTLTVNVQAQPGVRVGEATVPIAVADVVRTLTELTQSRRDLFNAKGGLNG